MAQRCRATRRRRHGDDAAGAARHGDRAGDVRFWRRLPRLLRERDRHGRVGHARSGAIRRRARRRRELRARAARPADRRLRRRRLLLRAADGSVTWRMPPAMNAGVRRARLRAARARPATRAGARAGRCSTSTARRAGRAAPSTLRAGRLCCDAPSLDAPPATTRASATGSGLAGECARDEARWCSGGQIMEVDCAARGADLRGRYVRDGRVLLLADACRLRGADRGPDGDGGAGREDLSVLLLRAHVAAGCRTR